MNKIYKAYTDTINESNNPKNDPWGYREKIKNELNKLADRVDSLSFREADFMYSDGDKAKAKRQIVALKAIETAVKKIQDKVEAAIKA